MKDLRGRVVVVTGAGSGIGRSIARAFAAEGSRVHVVDVRGDRAEAVADEIRATGAHAASHAVDVSDPGAVEALAERVVAAEGRVDVALNNAGIAIGGPFEQTSLDDWKRIVDVNLWGVVHGCRAFLPRMAARGEGVVVNTASVLGLFSIPHVSAYSATKFAVVGMSESLDAEYRDRGVRVLVLCPGLVATNIIADGKVATDRDPDGARTARRFARSGVSPDVIARDVVRGVKAEKALILSPAHAKVMAATKRFAPGLQRWINRMATPHRT